MWPVINPILSLVEITAFTLDSKSCKVHIFWEGHKILRNLPLTFDRMYCSQKLGEDFAKILWPSQNIWTLQDWLPVKILMKIYLDDLYSLFGIFFFLICWSIHCSHRFSMWKLIKDSRFKVSQALKTFTSIDKSHVLQKCRETSSNKCNSEIRQNLHIYFLRKIFHV